MYRQIYVSEDDKRFQRILWRENQSQPLQCIELQTVTYGTSCAPFLAVRTIRYLAEIYADQFPIASTILQNHCYVDDIITGCDNVDELHQIKHELTGLLRLGSLDLHKWCSNNTDFLNSIPETERESLNVHFSEGNKVIKTLGLHWDPNEDVFKITYLNQFTEAPTKRNILSFIAKIYDPLGLIGPVITPFKLFMQRLWCAKIDWDTPLDDELKKLWYKLIENIETISQIRIPRWIYSSTTQKVIQLHGYADASSLCYGAVLYMRVIDENNSVSIRLITSKSRVAPLKKITLPRLELMGALLLSRLTSKFLSICNIKISNVYLWSDSTIALSWINSDPSKWTSFVSNRVREIQDMTASAKWCHVVSKDNAADCLSRGLSADKLLNFDLWFSGPSCLTDINFKPKPYKVSAETVPHEVVTRVSLTNAQTVPVRSDNSFERSSTFTNLIRVTAYCARFINNCNKNNQKRTGPLTTQEIENATTKIILAIQRDSFTKELDQLRTQTPITSGKLMPLNPFVDESGLLRVGGRLKNSDLNFEQKHPIILPSENHVTKLLIIHEHQRLCHAGTHLLLANLRQKYWPLGGRRYTKKVIYQCIVCFRFRAKNHHQLMADLPPSRVTLSRPFLKTGVDLAGPIAIRQSRIRKSLETKAYIALFICMASKAVHLELLSSLTSDNFLLAFKRFFSRRGLPVQMFSDNATNFHGAKNHLDSVYDLINNSGNKIYDLLTINKIDWRFITPTAPHHGGLWESNIKTMKSHFKRVMGTVVLSYEETATVLYQIESVLNSRPLLPLSESSDDLNFLTPGHFLIGSALTEHPEQDVSETPVNRLKFWQQCCKVRQIFWRRWNLEYLHELQSRYKWQRTQKDLKMNTMVLLIEDNLPPLQWVVGRIIEVVKSPSDGHIRTVIVKTAKGTYKRPITKLAPMPFELNN